MRYRRNEGPVTFLGETMHGRKAWERIVKLARELPPGQAILFRTDARGAADIIARDITDVGARCIRWRTPQPGTLLAGAGTEGRPYVERREVIPRRAPGARGYVAHVQLLRVRKARAA